MQPRDRERMQSGYALRSSRSSAKTSRPSGTTTSPAVDAQVLGEDVEAERNDHVAGEDAQVLGEDVEAERNDHVAGEDAQVLGEDVEAERNDHVAGEDENASANSCRIMPRHERHASPARLVGGWGEQLADMHQVELAIGGRDRPGRELRVWSGRASEVIEELSG